LSNLNSIVTTSSGRYKGHLEDGILSWKGIRYAKPPTGKLRWKPPEPPEQFIGVKKADRYGNICPQKDYDSNVYSIPEEIQSEDCLHLNVWSKKESLHPKKAVLVWIHGGRLTRDGNSNPLYSGHYLAKKDVIFVSINYRLNVFGFFAHPDLKKESPE
jgi:para-nitrobenzyl esterase